jgi:hypothetical protein
MVLSPDQINGLFEVVGGLFALLNVRRVLRDKAVAGVSWVAVGFWSLWGFWNLYYYPHLDQWMSFYGGLMLVGANTTYVALLLYYGRRSDEAKEPTLP